MEAKNPNSNLTFWEMLPAYDDVRIIDISPGSIFVKISIGVVIIVLIILFAWIGNQAALYDKACTNLDNIYGKTVGPNVTYFSAENSIKDEAKTEFDTTSSKLINFHVKSAYNCCCGDGYKNNFVNLCALKKVITNGCRFLDFEIYSYNNDPIIASSTVENNYIKETYNALLLKDVLSTITKDAFDGTITNCARDPLILNFRVKSTNLTMLEKMGDLLEEYLDGGINSDFKLLPKNTPSNQVIQTKMKDLYKTIIIICTFFPTYNITLDPKLTTLRNLINLDGNGDYCRTYRYNEIAVKNINDTPFIDETSSKYIIVLPNLLDNSITNFDSNKSTALGCQAICMKHQNKDAKLEAYNLRFDEETNNRKYSWRWKLRSS